MSLLQAASEQTSSLAVEQICAAFAQFKVAPARPHEVAEARGFAARLIGGEIVSAETLSRVHRRTGVSLFLARDQGELTGVLAFLPLNARGRQALWSDTFSAIEPCAAHIATQGETPAAIYNWGIAASRHRAVKRLIDGYELMRREVVPGAAFFGRPVTEAGRRLMIDRLKFKSVPRSRTGLVWIEPIDQLTAAAAA
ncbi:MAG TPA: hypothetical protein VJP88_07435 [Caulobacteraceae bacterium]|nr:hypothetical protein [Caulobacteraceae bacterium]